jgi:hypothetical protein
MKQELYFKEFQKITNEMMELTKRKNCDYAGKDNAFRNFELIDYLTGGKVSTAEGILVRMSDKLQRISNLLYAENQVKDEKITDTLFDLSIYSIILNIYLKYGSQSQPKQKTALRSMDSRGRVYEASPAVE